MAILVAAALALATMVGLPAPASAGDQTDNAVDTFKSLLETYFGGDGVSSATAAGALVGLGVSLLEDGPCVSAAAIAVAFDNFEKKAWTKWPAMSQAKSDYLVALRGWVNKLTLKHCDPDASGDIGVPPMPAPPVEDAPGADAPNSGGGSGGAIAPPVDPVQPPQPPPIGQPGEQPPSGDPCGTLVDEREAVLAALQANLALRQRWADHLARLQQQLATARAGLDTAVVNGTRWENPRERAAIAELERRIAEAGQRVADLDHAAEALRRQSNDLAAAIDDCGRGR